MCNNCFKRGRQLDTENINCWIKRVELNWGKMKGTHQKKILLVRKLEHRDSLRKLLLMMCLFGLFLRPPMTAVKSIVQFLKWISTPFFVVFFIYYGYVDASFGLFMVKANCWLKHLEITWLSLSSILFLSSISEKTMFPIITLFQVAYVALCSDTTRNFTSNSV